MARHVLISGAGIGGLSAAIALAQTDRSLKIEIAEQAAHLDEVGAGLQLGPNAVHVLAKFGVKEAVVEKGFMPERALLRRYDNGKALLSMKLNPRMTRRYGQPFIQIHRADLHDILLAKTRELGVKIHLGRKVSGYQIRSDGRVITQTSAGEFDSDVLIGADGIKSAIRAQMHPAVKPVFTGFVARRALLPSSVLPAHALPQGSLTKDAHVFMGPEAHLVTYYVRGGALINFVAVSQQNDWTDEGWSQRTDNVELARAFGGWTPPIDALIGAADTIYKWGLFAHSPLPSWQDGPVTLLGDAAHPMLPFMAQGAAMAIEDAFVLARELGKSGAVSAALKNYEHLRLARTSRLQAISRQNADLYHAHSPAQKLMRKSKLAVASALPFIADWKFDRLYGYKA